MAADREHRSDRDLPGEQSGGAGDDCAEGGADRQYFVGAGEWLPARLQCAFTAAKAGVVHLTRTMAIELGEHGILVNCVAPGSTLTEGTKQLFYGERRSMQKDRVNRRLLNHIPLGRAGTVEDMAHAVLFFVAPESGYITGQTLCVDGGWTAGGFFRDF